MLRRLTPTKLYRRAVSTHFNMKLSIKHIGLISGLLSVILSSLFYGRKQEINQLLLIGGLIVSLIFFMAILFTKGTAKSKFIWTLVIFFSVALQWLTEPFLTKSSYRIFLKRNEKELTTINSILINKSSDISIFNNEINDKNELLSKSEKDELLKLRQKIDVYFITKTDDEIYYELWGFLDLRIGICYWIKNEKPDSLYRNLADRWYLHLSNN
jgi:hypothetical protein